MAKKETSNITKKQQINNRISSIKRRRQNAAIKGDKLNVQSLDIDLNIANKDAQKLDLQKQKDKLIKAKKREARKKRLAKKREEDNKKIKESLTMNNIKSFTEFVNESETENYKPPKFLVSPALDPDTQEPNDKLESYLRNKRKDMYTYFKPGISSANPPSDYFGEDDE